MGHPRCSRRQAVTRKDPDIPGMLARGNLLRKQTCGLQVFAQALGNCAKASHVARTTTARRST
eukprot:11057219-Alexandrium_andersonii.AAC.1